MLFYGIFQIAFLRYSQQWKKKVVFVLNKADIYRNNHEVRLNVSYGYYCNVITSSIFFY